MTWFRLYTDILNNPKVQRLKPELFKAWINLLCLAKEHDGVLPPLEDIAFALRTDEASVSGWLTELTARGLIDEIDDQLAPHNWESRQYKSDSSAERTRKWREKKRDVSIENSCDDDVTSHVTPPDTETDTDTGDKSPLPPIVPQPVKQSHPKPLEHPPAQPQKVRGRKEDSKISLECLSVDHIADWLAEKRGQGRYLHHDEHFVLEQFKQYCESKEKRYANYIAAYRNAFEWERCQPKAQASQRSAQPGGLGSGSAWIAEGDRLAAKYLAAAAEEAQRERESSAFGGP